LRPSQTGNLTDYPEPFALLNPSSPLFYSALTPERRWSDDDKFWL